MFEKAGYGLPAAKRDAQVYAIEAFEILESSNLWNVRRDKVMIRRFSKVLTALLVLGFVAACSSSGTLTVNQPLAQKIPPGQTVALSVEPDIEEPTDGHREVVKRLRNVLFGRLVSDRVFKQVVHAPERADYTMDVKLQGSREVSTGARIFLGVMAGSNNLNFTVNLYEQATGRLVASYFITGDSASHPFSSEAGLDDALREAADQVIVALQ